MRILHVVHQYPPDHMGGTELYTRAMAQRQARAGHAVAVFCPENGTERANGLPEEDGVQVYRMGAAGRSRAAVFLSTLSASALSAAFEHVLTEEQPDLVHLQHLMGLPVTIAGRLRVASIPYVITLHDYWYGCANAQLLTNYDETVCRGPDAKFHNCGRCALARAGLPGLAPAASLVAPIMARRNRLLREVFTGAKAVMASTPFVRHAHEQMGFPVDSVHILPLGADVSREDVAVAQEARRRRKPDGHFRIGYVGGISRQKGIHTLIAAANNLPKHVSFHIYGDTTVFPDYVEELRQVATHPGIRFMGILARDALWPALGALDILVVPTLWYETYSLVVQEAFAAGLPVVASRIGVMPDVIADGVNGRLFSPGDADELGRVLTDLIEHPEQVDALRANRPPVTTMDSHAAQLEAIYRASIAT